MWLHLYDACDIVEKARYQWQKTVQGLLREEKINYGGAAKYLRGQKCFASFQNFISVVIYLAALGSLAVARGI